MSLTPCKLELDLTQLKLHPLEQCVGKLTHGPSCRKVVGMLPFVSFWQTNSNPGADGPETGHRWSWLDRCEMTLVLSGDLQLENNDAEEKKWDAFLRQRGRVFRGSASAWSSFVGSYRNVTVCTQIAWEALAGREKLLKVRFQQNSNV